MVHALNLIDLEDEMINQTYFPIVLGCPWSSLSTITSPALGAFENGQISSGATSIALSDTSRYPHFYRYGLIQKSLSIDLARFRSVPVIKLCTNCALKTKQ